MLKLRHIFTGFMFAMLCVLGTANAEVAQPASSIATTVYVRKITDVLAQQAVTAQQTADGAVTAAGAAQTAADNAANAVANNWGKLPVKSGGVESAVAQIWVE